jgi:hypothetical protein
MTIFHCCNFETSSTKRARFLYFFPPHTGQSSYTTRHGFVWLIYKLYEISVLMYMQYICWAPLSPGSLQCHPFEVADKLRPMVSQPVHLGIRHPFECMMILVLYLTITFFLLHVTGLLWQEDRSMVSRGISSIVQVVQDQQPYFKISSDTPQTWRAMSLYLYPPRNRVA